MVLQVPAHAGTIEHNRDAELMEIGRRADARQQQDLRRTDRACRQNDLAPAARLMDAVLGAPAHADRAAGLPAHRFDETMRLTPQAAAPPPRPSHASFPPP